MPRQALVKCIVIAYLLSVYPNIRPAITAVNEVPDDGGESKGLAAARWQRTSGKCLERLPEFHAEGARLIHEQARPARYFCCDRAVIAEIRHLVGEILADDRHLEPVPREREACIDEPIRAAQSRAGGVVTAGETPADIGVIC